MAKHERVSERVIRAISDLLGVNEDDVTEDSRLVDDLGADDIDLVELSVELEEQFKVDEIDERDVMRWKHVRDVIRFFERGGISRVRGDDDAEDAD